MQLKLPFNYSNLMPFTFMVFLKYSKIKYHKIKRTCFFIGFTTSLGL